MSGRPSRDTPAAAWTPDTADVDYPEHSAHHSHPWLRHSLMAVRSHHLDVYDVQLHLTTDRRQLAHLRRRYGVKKVPMVEAGEFGGTCRFVTEPTDAPDEMHLAFNINIAAHRGDKGALLDTCAHEATHGAGLILDAAGAEYDGNSEPLAYLVAWLTRWIWEATA